MSVILNWLISNYSILISGFVAVLGAIISILSFFRERRNKALSEIVQDIPSFIAQIESCFPVGNGDIKLQYVLDHIREECSSLGFRFNRDYFVTLVESILSTPQKK